MFQYSESHAFKFPTPVRVLENAETEPRHVSGMIVPTE
jgi:hypothetical protein